jgi:hypothetical protein
MNARRVVEEFGGAKWTQDRRGKICVFDQVKVNDERERFTFQQLFSSPSLVPLAGAIGHAPSTAELEAIAKARVRDAVGAGRLDSWPPPAPVVLDPVDYREADMWVHKAGL